MAIGKKDRIRAKRRESRVKNRIKLGNTLPRVSVFRSIKYIYAQIIDDAAQATQASFSSRQLPEKVGDKKDQAHKVGLELAKRAQEKGIQKVVFDRGRFSYHGRLESLAQGLREGGLKF
ncbi:MAG: 50S ribosomal protein L18 [bacterium]|nr:50S ribosomal protein L18 [bacterium]